MGFLFREKWGPSPFPENSPHFRRGLMLMSMTVIDCIGYSQVSTFSLRGGFFEGVTSGYPSTMDR